VREYGGRVEGFLPLRLVSDDAVKEVRSRGGEFFPLAQKLRTPSILQPTTINHFHQSHIHLHQTRNLRDRCLLAAGGPDWPQIVGSWQEHMM